MSKLKAALQKVDDAVKDLTSLHVQTYTGHLDVTLDGSQSFEDIRKLVKDASKKTGNVEAKISLVAESLYRFDGDSYNFIGNSNTIPDSALELHKAAVEGGIKTRQGLMEMVKNIF